jgi:hypothetical protein
MNSTSDDSNDDETIVVCMRIDAIGPRTTSKLGFCDRCAFPIYIAVSTPTINGAHYRCLWCIDVSKIKSISQPTPEQIEDVNKHR